MFKQSYNPHHRTGDHLCYISDLTKVHAHFPEWQIEYELPSIVTELVRQHRRRLNAGSSVGRAASLSA